MKKQSEESKATLVTTTITPSIAILAPSIEILLRAPQMLKALQMITGKRNTDANINGTMYIISMHVLAATHRSKWPVRRNWNNSERDAKITIMDVCTNMLVLFLEHLKIVALVELSLFSPRLYTNRATRIKLMEDMPVKIQSAAQRK